MSRLLWSVAIVLLIVWVAVWLVFKVASGLVHLILIIAVTIVIVNVLQRLRARG
jgi:hypothetical protein